VRRVVGLPHLLAQTHDIVELYGGVDFTNTSPEPIVPKKNLTGFVVGVAPYANSWFGAALEISKQYGTAGSGAGSFANASLHESSYLAGPQFRFLNLPRLNLAFGRFSAEYRGKYFCRDLRRVKPASR
jgi:hypothetical protein